MSDWAEVLLDREIVAGREDFSGANVGRVANLPADC
jgi:hypothetical protein